MQQLKALDLDKQRTNRWKISYSANFLNMSILSPDLTLYIDMIAQSDRLFTMVSHDEDNGKLFFNVNPLDKTFTTVRDSDDYPTHDALDLHAREALTDLLRSEHMLVILRKSLRLKTIKLEKAKSATMDGTIITIADDNDIPWRINFTKKIVELDGESFNSSQRLPFRYNHVSGLFEYCVGFDGPNVPINKKIEWKSFFNACPEMNSILIEKLKSLRPV